MKLSDTKKVLLNSNGNAIVLGGPGSGKTTIALLKANREILCGSLKDGQKILFLSFARATIARVAEQAQKLISEECFKKIEINTYHGFTWNLLKSHGYLLRNGRQVSLLAPPEASAKLSEIKNFDDRSKEIRRLFIDDGLLHFDLFAEMASLLLSSSFSIRRIICDAYPFIILDEFQDTNQDEWSFVQQLARDSRLIALADADQRIYEFRGADPKRISEFIAEYSDGTFDLANENHRSTGTDIVNFGNDLITESNKSKKYKDVLIQEYGFYHGKSQFYSLKTAVFKSIQRLAKINDNWSIAILVPTKSLTLQISDYFASYNDGLKTLKHEVALDTEGPSLAAILLADLLEGGSAGLIATNLINNLCTHIRGRKGAKLPSQAELDLVGALDSFVGSGIIRGSKRKGLVSASQNIASIRANMTLSGDPALDWNTLRSVLESSGCEELKQVSTDAKYLNILYKGSSLRSRLNELWRTNGSYSGAVSAVRDALVQEHFSASIKDWNGIHVMTMHKSKGKEFSEVIIYEGYRNGKILRADANGGSRRQSLLTLRVAVTRAISKATILTPKSDRCPFL